MDMGQFQITPRKLPRRLNQQWDVKKARWKDWPEETGGSGAQGLFLVGWYLLE